MIEIGKVSNMLLGAHNPRDVRFLRNDPDPSLNNVFCTNSTGTSHSSINSFSSVHSYGSRGASRASGGSRGSGGSSPSSGLGNPRARIKKRSGKKRSNVRSSLNNPLNRFQCTFCTETFKTKHDWQRHEKSLHVPLEKWICTPDGPRVVQEESGQALCAFCGEVNPDEQHLQSHNPSFCRERTFSRKDHLKQHLRLVHNAAFVERLMEKWKTPSLQIRSRCGFCGISMDTWELRTDHLADHFKMGQTMAAWKGDWGFEVEVLKMIEDSIPPCKMCPLLNMYLLLTIWIRYD
jgi:hypothetical protein